VGFLEKPDDTKEQKVHASRWTAMRWDQASEKRFLEAESGRQG
jgi:hypothetical protein